MRINRPESSEDVASVRYQDGFFVRVLQRPPRARWVAILVVVLLLLGIGVLDHWTGQRVFLLIFYLTPIMLAAAWFGAWEGYAMALACSIVHTVADWMVHTEDYTWVTLWNRLMVLVVYVGVARCVTELMALQRLMEERVQLRTRELAKALEEQTRLQGKIGAASRYERSALGRELHDGLCQHLAATNIAAGILARKLDATHSDAAAEAQTISGMLGEAIGQTRQIARGLLLAAVKPSELRGELQELCRTVTSKHGVECVWECGCSGALAALDETQSAHLFFIAQEALRNALKHAQASRIEMTVRMNQGALELLVADNGKGFSTGGGADATDEVGDTGEAGGGVRTGLGLEIMRHRAELIGAQLVVESVAAGAVETAAGLRGTRICCRLPQRAVPASGAVLP